MNQKIVLDLNKVQFAEFSYVNQEGLHVCTKPHNPTVRGLEVGEELAHYHQSYPGETMIERAKRLDILDVWTASVTFHVCANRCVRFRGEKAITMWKAWNKKIYGKQNRK